MEVHNPDEASLKCPTCVQEFANIAAHKNHYKSDFHRYNLKRKMVKLAPITEEQFKAKKTESHAEENEGFKCNECGYWFNYSGRSLTPLKHSTSMLHPKSIIQTNKLSKKKLIKLQRKFFNPTRKMQMCAYSVKIRLKVLSWIWGICRALTASSFHKNNFARIKRL